MFVLLGCAVSVIFGIRQLIYGHSDSEMTYSVEGWEGYQVPRYTGPAVYSASSRGSSVSVPMVSTSSRALFHHNAGGAYYSQRTVTMPSSSVNTPYKVYQTSSSAVRTIGGGGSAGGYTGYSGSMSSGVTGSGASGASSGFSVPGIGTNATSAYTYAYSARPYVYNNIGVTSTGMAEAPVLSNVASLPSRSAKPGIRKVPGYNGEEEGDIGQDGSEIWMWDGEEWVTPTTKIEGGKVYAWDPHSNDWVFVQDQADPDSPIGDVPWILFLLLTAGYIVCRKLKTTKEETSKQ